MSTPSSPLPLPSVTFNKDDFEEHGLTLFNQQWNNVIATLNRLAGHAGPIQLANDIDMSGRNIKNVGAPADPTDVISNLIANQLYGAAALQPQMEQLGNQVLQTTRQLNNRYQREQYSSFLNGLVSTPPTTNTATVSASAPSGGSVTVTITSGFHQYVDGSQVPFSVFHDTITLPTSYTINTLTRSGNTVNGSTTGANVLVPGENFYITGSSDPTFNGAFLIDTASSPNFSYTQFAPDSTSSGGTISLGGVYYYYLQRGLNVLGRSGGFTTDTLQNRLAASVDGQTIIAVVVVNGGGLVTTESAAGATPPATTSGNRILLRL